MISIVIPTWNQNEMTLECVTAVRQFTEDCEIIVVDNGSDPPLPQPYTGFIECRVLRNEANLGFPVAINQGIRESHGDTIIVLNNDVVVTPRWADRLTAALDEYGIVGPTTNYAMGLQRVQIAPYSNEKELCSAVEEWSENCGRHTQEVRWVIGFCMAFSRRLFDEIGPFDETLWPCCGEEIDFCLRARKINERVGIVTGCYVHHIGSVTFGSINQDHSYSEIVDRNNKYLDGKWGKDWNEQSVGFSRKANGASINLGCGRMHLDGFINIDNRLEMNPDLLCDVTKGLPYEDETIDIVRADDFLEHIPIGSVIPVMNEIWRVLKPRGIFESLTPSTDGRGAFQDPTHVSFWNRNSWDYYSNPKIRELYGIKADFDIENIEDIETDRNNMIIHTHVIARARK